MPTLWAKEVGNFPWSLFGQRLQQHYYTINKRKNYENRYKKTNKYESVCW